MKSKSIALCFVHDIDVVVKKDSLPTATEAERIGIDSKSDSEMHTQKQETQSSLAPANRRSTKTD